MKKNNKKLYLELWCNDDDDDDDDDEFVINEVLTHESHLHQKGIFIWFIHETAKKNMSGKHESIKWKRTHHEKNNTLKIILFWSDS